MVKVCYSVKNHVVNDVAEAYMIALDIYQSTYIEKFLSDSQKVVESLNLAYHFEHKHSVFGYIGPNGAGKSTTMETA